MNPDAVSLREITSDNWQKVLELKVRDDQAGFVASNVYSLAESKVFPDCVPLAIYAGEQPVGFLMYTFENERKEWWIFRLMISADQQGKGYGRSAMQQAVTRMRNLPGCDKIFISFEPNNAVAEQLYRSLGFVPNQEIVDGEVVFRLDLPGETKTLLE